MFYSRNLFLLLAILVALVAAVFSASFVAEKAPEDDKDNPCWNVGCPQCQKCQKAYECDKEQAKAFPGVCSKTYCVANPGCSPIDPCSTKKCEPNYNCKLDASARPVCYRNYSHQPRCFYPMDEGKICNKGGPYPRYAYDIKTNRCSPFGYKGCGGNNNRFGSIAKCLRACRN